VSDKLRQKAFDYVGDHLERAPIVALARVGPRLEPVCAGPDGRLQRGRRPRGVGVVGRIRDVLAAHTVAIYGYVVLRRRGVERWPSSRSS
jgi:hypothetical protein